MPLAKAKSKAASKKTRPSKKPVLKAAKKAAPTKAKMVAKPRPRAASATRTSPQRPPAQREERDNIPSYSELPIRAGAPAGSAWGVFGDQDEVGTINLLTPARVRAAKDSIKSGKVFALNLPIDVPNPPLFTRQAHKHTVKTFGGELDFVLDDYLDNFYPQASSQWDALCHVMHPELGAYNGIPKGEITGRGGKRLGIDNLARRGIAGRGVLADVGRYYESIGKKINYTKAESIPLEDLEATLEHQKSKLRNGDILLIRIGWTQFYYGASTELKEELARETVVPGIEGTQRVAEWIWNHHLAAVASDSPALEALPKAAGDPEFLHFHMLAFFGMPIGEMWNLEELGEDCASDGQYEFFVTSAPLNVPGGVGSPPNALAIK
jgi:kynurenine formamidase